MPIADNPILPNFGNLNSFWEKTTTATNISFRKLVIEST